MRRLWWLGTFMYKRWTKKELAEVLLKVKEGISYYELEYLTGRTKKSIFNKISKNHKSFLHLIGTKKSPIQVRCECGNSFFINYDPTKDKDKWLSQRCPACDERMCGCFDTHLPI